MQRSVSSMSFVLGSSSYAGSQSMIQKSYGRSRTYSHSEKENPLGLQAQIQRSLNRSILVTTLSLAIRDTS